MKRIQKIDQFFDHVSSHLCFSKINPTNADKVRSKFSRKAYCPTFEYEPIEHLEALGGILDVMEFPKDPMSKLYDKKRKELILKLELLQARGTKDFSKISQKLYPPPDAKLIKQAKRILKLSKTPKDTKIPKKDAVKLLRKGIANLGLNWKVKNKKMVASAEVNSSDKTLYIRTSERFAQNYTKRLIIHEIGTHVVRGANANLQKLKLFKNGFPNYLETEEGLAAYNEYNNGLMTNSVLRNYAGRVLAIHFALHYSFEKTYKKLTKYFPKKTSLKLTIRAKRGLPNGRMKGAYTKDVVYLRGFLKVAEYAKKHSLEPLYIGKIGLADLKFLKQLPHKEAVFLPRDVGDIEPSKHKTEFEV